MDEKKIDKNFINEQFFLVSVVVMTYNSDKYVIQALDSIKKQTYKRLELIVTDDGSKDTTVSICESWLTQNSCCFENAELVTVNKNTGTTGNLNRGIKKSHGTWIKTIAGDDKLKENCISSFMEAVALNKGDFYLCDLDVFSDEDAVDKFYVDSYIHYFNCVKESTKEKKKRIIHEFKLPGPGWFFSRKLYDDVGGFDEKYKLMEEWPYVYKVLKKGYDIIPLEKKLVDYRISNTSVCHSYNQGLIPKQFFIDKKNFFYDTIKSELIKQGHVFEVWSKILEFFVYEKLYNNPKGLRRKLILSLRLLDPIEGFKIIRRWFTKK